MTKSSRSQLDIRKLTLGIGLVAIGFGAGWHFANSNKDTNLSIDSTKSTTPSYTVVKIPSIEAKLEKFRAEYTRAGGHEILSDSITPVDASELAPVFAKLPHTTYNKEALSVLAGRWAQAYPVAALAWAKNQPQTYSQAAVLSSILKEWSNHNPIAALSALNEIKSLDNEAVMDVRIAALTKIAVSDPQKALQILQSLPMEPGIPGRQEFDYIPSGPSSVNLYDAVFTIWASYSPADAANAALKVPTGKPRNRAIRRVAQLWSVQDVNAALKWAQALPQGMARDDTIDDVLTELPSADPQFAGLYIGNLPKSYDRNELVSRIISEVASADPLAGLTWVNALPAGEIHDDAMQAMLKNLSAVDPIEAIKHLPEIKGSLDRDRYLNLLADNWARIDIPAALAWAKSLPPSKNADTIDTVIDVWITKDPKEAAKYILTLSKDPNFATLCHKIAEAWARVDSESAYAWAINLPSGEAHNFAVYWSLEQMAENDFDRAFDYAMKLPSGQEREENISHVFQYLRSEPTAKIFAYFDSITNPKDKASAGHNIAFAWAHRNAPACLKWIEELPVGGARDSAIRTYISLTEDADYAVAFKLCVTISDKTARLQEMEDLVRKWHWKDIAAAQAAVAGSQLPEDERAYLFKIAENRY